MKRLVLAAAALIGTTFAHANLSIEVFRQLSNGGVAGKFDIEMYVGGVVKGYLQANGYLTAAKQSPLFCYGGDISTEKALQIASQAVKQHRTQFPGDDQKEIVEFLLLKELRRAYPC